MLPIVEQKANKKASPWKLEDKMKTLKEYLATPGNPHAAKIALGFLRTNDVQLDPETQRRYDEYQKTEAIKEFINVRYECFPSFLFIFVFIFPLLLFF